MKYNYNVSINQVQTECDSKIGSANYDIGHLFSGGSNNGLAQRPAICRNGEKGRGVTIGVSPIGDPFDVDCVAHEIGHQFGCSHTQNNNCNRTAAPSMEPGSASTIMG